MRARKDRPMIFSNGRCSWNHGRSTPPDFGKQLVDLVTIQPTPRDMRLIDVRMKVAEEFVPGEIRLLVRPRFRWANGIEAADRKRHRYVGSSHQQYRSRVVDVGHFGSHPADAPRFARLVEMDGLEQQR